MAKVYLSLGSNLGDRELYLESARDFISSRIGKIVKESSIYESEPWGFDSNNNFLNQVVKVETNLSPAAIMLEISFIETKLKRERTGKGYSSRTIDIDVLFYDHLILYTPELIIPHKQLHKRNFVIEPLKEIAADYIHPLFSITVNEIAVNCKDDSKVWRYDSVKV